MKRKNGWQKDLENSFKVTLVQFAEKKESMARQQLQSGVGQFSNRDSKPRLYSLTNLTSNGTELPILTYLSLSS